MTSALLMTSAPFLKLKIVGKRLLMRPYKASDFKRCRKSNEARLAPQSEFDDPIPAASETDFLKFKQQLQKHRMKAEGGIHFIFGVYEKKSGDFVGQIDIYTINRELRWGNLGYHMQNQHFGKGYASEAAKLGLRAAFQVLGFHRIEAAMNIRNKASKKVAIKIGLTAEGKRKKFLPQNNSADMFVFAANAIDYKC